MTFTVEYLPYLPAAGQAGIVYLMDCVDSTALPVTHKAPVRSKTSKVACQSAIKVRQFLSPHSLAARNNVLKVNSTISPKSVIAIPMAIAGVVLVQQDKVSVVRPAVTPV